MLNRFKFGRLYKYASSLNSAKHSVPLVVAFVAIGFFGLQATHAASYIAANEAENGALTGSVASGDSTGASGNASVKFGSVISPTPPTQPLTCSLNATTANFAAQVASARVGQTVCLASGNYGVWIGTDKAITIAEQAGATASMSLNFNTGDGGFTIDGLTVAGGDINGGAHDITVKNSTFTGSITFDGVANANILFDHNTHNNIDAPTGSSPARIHLAYTSNTPSGVTIQNSILDGGDSDGIQAGTGLAIINNEFKNIKQNGPNHTDAIQLLTAPGTIIRGNYIHDSSDGIVAYDGVERATIENNVIKLVYGRWGIEMYADSNSIIRHNTLVYGSGCEYAPCGHIILDHKTADPAGVGTVIENNIAYSIDINNGSAASVNSKNMIRTGVSGGNFGGTPIFAGGADPTTYSGFKLAADSPGKSVGSDGKDVGINF